MLFISIRDLEALKTTLIKSYRFLIKKNGTKKILIVCTSPEGYVPGQQLKYEQYFEHWQENDYNIIVKPFISESFQKSFYKKDLTLKFYHNILGCVSRIQTLSQLRQYDTVYVFL